MGGRIPAFDDHENVLKLKRRQKSPLKDEEESLLLTPFDKPKAKGERKPLEDPSLENMGKLNKQPSKQEIDVNEKEIDGPGEVTNRLETKTGILCTFSQFLCQSLSDFHEKDPS